MVTINEQMPPRKLIARDYRAMNLPPNTWNARLSKVHSSAKTTIEQYLEKRTTVMERGWGLLLYGPKGCGKTSIAAGVLKVFRSYGYSSYFTTPLQLKDAQLSYQMHDEDQTFLRMCMNVDLLVLDDITPENARDPIFGGHAITQLIKHRRDWQRPTLVTTSVSLQNAGTPDRKALEFLAVHNAWLEVQIAGTHGSDEIENVVFGGKR